MSDKIEVPETGNETIQKAPVSEISPKFWLSEPDKIDDGAGDWGFTIFADKDVFLASVSYVTQADAMRGRIAMAEALKDAIHLATSKSSAGLQTFAKPYEVEYCVAWSQERRRLYFLE